MGRTYARYVTKWKYADYMKSDAISQKINNPIEKCAKEIRRNKNK